MLKVSTQMTIPSMETQGVHALNSGPHVQAGQVLVKRAEFPHVEPNIHI